MRIDYEQSWSRVWVPNRVVIWISRLTSNTLPDLIIVLKEGQVAEQGTHEELLKKGGLYYTMWVEQASDAVIEDLPRQEEGAL